MSQQLQAGCCCGDVEPPPPPEITCLSPCFGCSTAYFAQVVSTGEMLGGTYILVASSTMQQGQFGGCVFEGQLNGSLTINGASNSIYNGTYSLGFPNTALHGCRTDEGVDSTIVEIECRVDPGFGGVFLRFPIWRVDLNILIQCPDQSAALVNASTPELSIGQPSGVPLFGSVDVWQWTIT